MTLFKPATLALGLSLGVHAAMGWSFAHGWSGWKQAEPIEISYLEPRPAQAVKTPGPSQEISNASASGPKTAKKKFPGIPVPREPASSDFQKNMDAKLKKQSETLARLSGTKPAPAPPAAKTRPKTAAEMLADPQKGMIYVEYLGKLREKIQGTLHKRFSGRYSGRGNVTLIFVLNPQGYIEKVSVSPRDAQEDEMLRDMAVQCLRESAPFGKFPPQLGSDRMAFSVTVVFDGQ